MVSLLCCRIDAPLYGPSVAHRICLRRMPGSPSIEGLEGRGREEEPGRTGLLARSRTFEDAQIRTNINGDVGRSCYLAIPDRRQDAVDLVTAFRQRQENCA